jgi:hypothetical protein
MHKAMFHYLARAALPLLTAALLAGAAGAPPSGDGTSLPGPSNSRAATHEVIQIHSGPNDVIQ